MPRRMHSWSRYPFPGMRVDFVDLPCGVDMGIMKWRFVSSQARCAREDPALAGGARRAPHDCVCLLAWLLLGTWSRTPPGGTRCAARPYTPSRLERAGSARRSHRLNWHFNIVLPLGPGSRVVVFVQ